jgi:succinate dehydrogenase flavin-adding protein (antitoxin of CptAB toxin-antitoxin module)
VRRANRNLKLQITKILDDILNEMDDELYNWVTDRMMEMNEAQLKENLREFLINPDENQKL